MNRKTPAKVAGPGEASGRLDKALAYHKASRNALESIHAGEIADPVIALITLAAIAYADALTAKFGGKVNQKDHARIADLLSDTLGAEFPKEQAARLKRMLSRKDIAQYGSTATRSKGEVEMLLVDLDRFAAYSEAKLKS